MFPFTNSSSINAPALLTSSLVVVLSDAPETAVAVKVLIKSLLAPNAPEISVRVLGGVLSFAEVNVTVPLFSVIVKCVDPSKIRSSVLPRSSPSLSVTVLQVSSVAPETAVAVKVLIKSLLTPNDPEMSTAGLMVFVV